MPTISVSNTDANLSNDTLLTAENSETKTGLLTFDRDPNPPFAVSANSAAVTNLDADKLDGQEGSYYRPSDLASCQAFHSATQSLATGIWTSVVFNSEDFDNGGCHDTGSNTSRLTVPANQGGVYLLVALLEWAPATGGVRGLRFAKNGTQVGNIFFQQELNESGAGNGVSASLFQSLSAADYVEVQALQDTGGPVNLLAGARFGFVKLT